MKKQSMADDRPALLPLPYMPNETNTRGQSHLSLSSPPQNKKKKKSVTGDEALPPPSPSTQNKDTCHIIVPAEKKNTIAGEQFPPLQPIFLLQNNLFSK